MKLKSLLLGSAAALVAFSGARAADAVIAEPEPVEYVRVCDAYGAGFFYIPGTETCLKIGGFVRYDIDVKTGDDTWKKTTQANVSFTAKSDTEMGPLVSYIELTGKAVTDGSAVTTDTIFVSTTDGGTTGIDVVSGTPIKSAFGIDSAYLSLGGLKMGFYSNAFDGGIVGEGDSLGGTTTNSMGYTFASGGFDGTIQLDHMDGDDDFIPNVSANAGFSAGAVAVRVFGAYDQSTSEGAVKLRVGADVTEGGRLEAAVAYATGANYSWDDAEWTVAVGYSQKVSDAITIVGNGQYWSDVGGVSGVDKYKVGAMVDWTPVTNFLVRAQVYYTNTDGVKSTEGKLRFQRSF